VRETRANAAWCSSGCARFVYKDTRANDNSFSLRAWGDGLCSTKYIIPNERAQGAPSFRRLPDDPSQPVRDVSGDFPSVGRVEITASVKVHSGTARGGGVIGMREGRAAAPKSARLASLSAGQRSGRECLCVISIKRVSLSPMRATADWRAPETYVVVSASDAHRVGLCRW
jgi:hypothetical protein